MEGPMAESGHSQKPGASGAEKTAPSAADPEALPAQERSHWLKPAGERIAAEQPQARFARIRADRERVGADLGRRIPRKAAGPGGGRAKIPETGGAPLDGGVRSKMEGHLGAPLDDVKVHTSGESQTAAGQLGARAFTVGGDVHFASGQYAPGTKEGDRLLAHELTHVVQGQRSGVKRKTTGEDAAHGGAEQQGEQLEVSQPGEPAEKEADDSGDRFAEKEHGAGGKKKKKGDKKDEKQGAGAPAAGHASDGAKDGAHETGGAQDAGGAHEQAPPIAANLEGVGRKIYLAGGDKKPATTTTPTDKSKEKEKENPDFEKDAIAFETALGGKAMSHGAANAAAKAMTDKAHKMVQMIAKKGNEAADKQKEYEKKFQETLGAMAGNEPGVKSMGIAGAVGNDAAVLEEVFADGNLRERLTIIFNFMRPFSATLVAADVQEREKFIQELHLNGEQIKQRLDKMKTDPKMQLVGDPAQTMAKMQNAAREDGGEKQSSRDASSLPKGAELSKREVKFQGLQAKPDGSANEAVQQTLKWKEGADKWKAKADSEYVQKLRSLKLPFGAGPSGTTDRIMSMAQLLGYGDTYAARLACIGYLLPIRAHSLHEIMLAASTYGCDFTDGQKLYTNVKPLSEAE